MDRQFTRVPQLASVCLRRTFNSFHYTPDVFHCLTHLRVQLVFFCPLPNNKGNAKFALCFES